MDMAGAANAPGKGGLLLLLLLLAPAPPPRGGWLLGPAPTPELLLPPGVLLLVLGPALPKQAAEADQGVATPAAAGAGG